jgi:hypothetical protein
VLSLLSCRDESEFPTTPQLKVREFSQISQDAVLWRIGFTDGDGDFGVRNDNDADNFILSIFSIENGQANDVPATNYRIPQIKGVPTDKGVEGEFVLNIDNLDLLRIDGIDSLYFRGYAVDRAGNRSNTIESPRFGI